MATRADIYCECGVVIVGEGEGVYICERCGKRYALTSTRGDGEQTEGQAEAAPETTTEVTNG